MEQRGLATIAIGPSDLERSLALYRDALGWEVVTVPNTPPEERKKKAQDTLDELITLYEDDEEGWFWRAQAAEGVNGGTGVALFEAYEVTSPSTPPPSTSSGIIRGIVLRGATFGEQAGDAVLDLRALADDDRANLIGEGGQALWQRPGGAGRSCRGGRSRRRLLQQAQVHRRHHTRKARTRSVRNCQ